jgi:hypothetical protein
MGAMTDRILTAPRGRSGVNLELHGDLARILAPQSAANAKTRPRCARQGFCYGSIWLRGHATTDTDIR